MALFKVHGLASTAPAVDIYRVETASGTFTVPAGVNRIEAFCIGGGGGGSCGEAWNVINDRESPDDEWIDIYTQFRIGGAGGGGGHIASRVFNVTEGQQFTITIGSGGAGAYDNQDSTGMTSVGGDGGATSFGSSSAGYVTAQGGSGGRVYRSSATVGDTQDFVTVGGNGGSGGAPGAVSYWYDSSLSNDRWSSTYSNNGYNGGSNGASTGGSLPTDTPTVVGQNTEYIRRYQQVRGAGDGAPTLINNTLYSAGGGGGHTVIGRERVGSSGSFDFYYNTPGEGGNYGGGPGGGSDRDRNYTQAQKSAIANTGSGGGGSWLRYEMTSTGNYWWSGSGGNGSNGVVVLHLYHT